MKTWTIIELLKETEQYFKKKGIETSRLDAELLLSHCLKKDRVKLYVDFESPVTPEELSGFRDFVRRRAKREPVSYILCCKEFWSTKIKVNRDVLIPRPETEVLVEEVCRILKSIRQNSSDRQRILEIGTGSGAIPVSLTKEHKNVLIVSIDISSKALKTAKQNISLRGLDKTVMLVCGDCLRPLRGEETFEMIVSNPPYIRTEDFNRLEPEIKNHEPRVALDGGKDGLDFYRQWIPELPVVLKPGGWAVLEIGDGQAPAVTQIFMSSGSYEDIKVVKDYARHDRVIAAKVLKRDHQNVEL